MTQSECRALGRVRVFPARIRTGPFNSTTQGSLQPMKPDLIAEPIATEPEKPIEPRNDWMTRYSRGMARLMQMHISTVAI
jgi:hypothetical protein